MGGTRRTRRCGSFWTFLRVSRSEGGADSGRPRRRRGRCGGRGAGAGFLRSCLRDGGLGFGAQSGSRALAVRSRRTGRVGDDGNPSRSIRWTPRSTPSGMGLDNLSRGESVRLLWNRILQKF
jgi:hypothetical protein